MPRRYNAPERQRKASQTRDRIVAAGSELAHECASWDWRSLTFRAVAERAGVGERTVYRHFPSERHLHDAVMGRLEEEAGITYDDIEVNVLAEVALRIFLSLKSFAAWTSAHVPEDATFLASSDRRQRAMLRAVSSAAPHWTETQSKTVAGLLDALGNVPTYARLVDAWHITNDDAAHAIGWVIDKVVQAITDDEPPPSGPWVGPATPSSP